MKVLVTICNYNHSRFLIDSIRSIQGQDHEDLDICVVDDGSDDQEKVIDLVEGIKKEDGRVRSIYLPNNKGKWHCLNEAIRTSEAAICTSHDADDISLSWRISSQLSDRLSVALVLPMPLTL